MSKLNIELFKKVRERIATVPESYNQAKWYAPSDAAPCGTVACLAGEAIICAEKTVEAGVERLRELAEEASDVPYEAARLLGLPAPTYGPANQTASLFFSRADGWPEPFKSQFKSTWSYRNQAQAAVAYLDWIIANNRIFPEEGQVAQ